MTTAFRVMLVCALCALTACDSPKKPAGDDAKAKDAPAAKADDAKAAEKPVEKTPEEKAAEEKAAAEAKAAQEAEAKKEAEKSWGRKLCGDSLECYKEAEFAGAVNMKIEVDVDAAGKVSAVSITGDTPKPIQNCLQTRIKARSIDGYEGAPGKARCTFNGNYSSAAVMMAQDFKFERSEEAAAPADDAAKGDEKK